MSEHFYFEPTTGIVKDTPIRSNFYVYRLRNEHRVHIERWAKICRLGPHGLEYPNVVMQALARLDTRWDQKTGLTPRPWDRIASRGARLGAL